MFKKNNLLWFIVLGLVLVVSINNSSRKDPLKKMKTLSEIIRLVNDNYVDDVDMDKIMEGAINGMLDEIDEYDMVTFELERGLKGMNAVRVKKA